MAVMIGGMRLLTALREGTINCNAIYARFLFNRNSRSASSPAPPSSEKYVAAPLVLRSNVPRATRIAAVPDALYPRVLVLDGFCQLTLAGVKWLIKNDRDMNIKFCCLQSNAAEPYIRMCGLEREHVLRRILFVESSGSYYCGSSACLRILSYLPPPYSVLSNLMIIPAPLRDALYDCIAENRYSWFGKYHDFMNLEDIEFLNRFIDIYEILERNRFRRNL